MPSPPYDVGWPVTADRGLLGQTELRRYNLRRTSVIGYKRNVSSPVIHDFQQNGTRGRKRVVWSWVCCNPSLLGDYIEDEIHDGHSVHDHQELLLHEFEIFSSLSAPKLSRFVAFYCTWFRTGSVLLHLSPTPPPPHIHQEAQLTPVQVGSLPCLELLRGWNSAISNLNSLYIWHSGWSVRDADVIYQETRQ